MPMLRKVTDAVEIAETERQATMIVKSHGCKRFTKAQKTRFVTLRSDYLFAQFETKTAR